MLLIVPVTYAYLPAASVHTKPDSQLHLQDVLLYN